jgi:serpin B
MSSPVCFSAFPPALYKALDKRQGNLLCSPFGVQLALGMALLGAEGETRKQLAKALDSPPMIDQDTLVRCYRDLLKDVTPVKDEIELSTANALWANENFDIKSAYLEAVQSLGSDLQKVDYSQASAACDKINGWVRDKTKDKIDRLVSPSAIKKDTRLVLTNAIYFKGKWNRAFDSERTKPRDFHTFSGDVKAPMMNQKGNFGYCENNLFQVLELPYKGMSTSMLIVLPRKNGDLAEIEKQWDLKMYSLIIRELSNEDVTVTIPKFKFSSPVINLKSILTAQPPEGMGAGLAFSDDADFGGISKERLKIDDVLHKSFVDMGEEGTEAAAATAVTMVRLAAFKPKEQKAFVADHPFLFIIRNRMTDTVLFQGRLADPSKSE